MSKFLLDNSGFRAPLLIIIAQSLNIERWKNHVYRHEVVPEFCVRFAIILQMSNQLKFWTSITNIKPS